MQRRVVVTGIGLITCLGSGKDKNWRRLSAGESGIGPLTQFDCSEYSARIAGEVRGDFDPEGKIKKETRRMDRHQQFTMLAAAEAVEDGELDPAQIEDPYKCGVILGSGMGGLFTIEEGVKRLSEKGPRRGTYPLVIPKAVINLAPGMLAMKYGFRGPNFGIANACTSGTSALGEAYRLIREGRADIMIAGGAEAIITPLCVAAFMGLRALSTRNEEPEKASRPFDKDRDGFVLSEGAGILLVESQESAKRRGVKPYCEIKGYAATDDAYHMVMPDPEGQGAYQAMRLAIEDAGLAPEAVDYINAHGTSTELNDIMETKAIKKLYGNNHQKVSISSNKSMIGHLLGAAGAVEAIFTILTIKHGIIPPTINLENPDPECDLDYTPLKAVKKDVAIAISNSFAFGGQNASLVMGAP
jgi:3-oxoacyl-[acyl-carrier-protein] synthase II